MGLVIRFLPEHRLVLVIGEGPVTGDELVGHLEMLAADPRYRAPMKKLVDCHRAGMAALTRRQEDAISATKNRHRAVFAGERCAIVLNNDVDYGMARMHAVHIEPAGIETEVFRRLADALRWLDVDLREEDLAPDEPADASAR